MKKRNLEKKIAHFGWWFSRHGGNHDVWTNGKESIPIPRHNEINEYTARGILKTVKENPPLKEE